MNSKFSSNGWCPICEEKVLFSSTSCWFRDSLLCSKCASIPRERALMRVIMERFPNYRDLVIHETSPVNRGASAKLLSTCSKYTTSQYFKDVKMGVLHKSGVRCENLESLTFADTSFDLFVSQDVMEHVFNPINAFREIHRVLKPGGAHIFTVPLINKWQPSERWANLDNNGAIVHYGAPEYHGNPVDPDGALVTMHWGYDIAAFIAENAKMSTIIIKIDDIGQGIRAEFIEVLVSTRE
jgi:SAM-dependent methyltransferase